MRTLAPFHAIFALVLLAVVVSAFTKFARVAQVTNPFAAAADEEKPPPTLEEAAPEAARHREAFRTLAASAKSAERLCKDRSTLGDEPEARGKALIWDETTDDISDAQGRLPADVRAPDATGDVTLFLVTKRDRKPIINYNFDFFSGRSGPAGVRGFCTESYVCVVAAPTLKPLGRYKVYGSDPPGATRVKPGTTEVDGDWAGPLAKWVEGCVRGPKWRQKQRETPVPPEHEPFDRMVEEARTVLPQCQALGAAGRIPPLPAKALIWNSQPKALLNHLSLAQTLLPAERRAEPTDTKVLVVLVIGSDYYRPNGGRGVPPEKDVDRFDSTVALVVMPGPQPVGVFKVLGDEWPAERRRVKRDGPDVNLALARWVTDFMKRPAVVGGPTGVWPTAKKRGS